MNPLTQANVLGKADREVFTKLMPSDYDEEKLAQVSQQKDVLFCAKAKEQGVPVCGIEPTLSFTQPQYTNLVIRAHTSTPGQNMSTFCTLIIDGQKRPTSFRSSRASGWCWRWQKKRTSAASR